MGYNNSKLNIFLPSIAVGVIALSIVAGIFIGRRQAMNAYSDQIPNTLMASDKLSAILSLIDNYYVDSVALDSISEEFIPQILAKLDPHSVYIPVQEYASANEPLDGEFDGIGVMFNMSTDTVVVLNVIPGGPSEKAGVLGGDRIITIDGVKVAGVKMEQDSVVRKLRGKRGSDVKLGISRHSVKGLLPITVTRGVIPIKSIDSYFRIEPNIACLKLSRFSRNTHQEFMDAMLKMKASGKIDQLIFDLRGNSGGFLDQAILIANEFLDKDKLIVYTQGAHNKRREQYSDGKGRFKNLDVKLLIDEGSASASEIVAGALQDNDRGMIYGRRSFGKGLVQEQIPFRDGSAVRLTIARYYTPLGRSIQKPYDKGVEAYNLDIMNRFTHNELLEADSIKLTDTVKYVTKGGRVLYGGGGIMPDVFVPIDTVSGRFLKTILHYNLIVRHSFIYADENRDDLNNIKTLQQLDCYFEKKDGRIRKEFLHFVGKAGLKPSAEELRHADTILKWQLRAYIGRNTLLEDNAFYHYIRHIDNVMERVLKN